MNKLRRTTFAVAAIVASFLAGVLPAAAQSTSSIAAPPAPRAWVAESLRLAPGAAPAAWVGLEPIDPRRVEEAKRANARSFLKRLDIGIGRPVDAGQAKSGSLRWTPVEGGRASHWEVASPGAQALRIGIEAERLPPGTQLRFVGRNSPDTVYGPVTMKLIRAAGPLYWSPVLEGESALVEAFVPDGQDVGAVSMEIVNVSHLFVSPSDPLAEKNAKIGESGSCEVDFICRAASDSALANVGRAVARMTWSTSGGTALCTGTLLRPEGTLTPYFYSAHHCISSQSDASNLTTHWFYDRTGCGSGGVSSGYVQRTGGATYLYSSSSSDALLLRLNDTPPTGSVYAGWDANTVSNGTPLTAVHHPAGDVKKVSLGSMGGFGTYGGGSRLIANWNSLATGVTEGGSSGSGIFTAVGSPATDYQLRGGLHGGPSSCSASSGELFDYYSRLDQVYPNISQYLTGSAPPPPPPPPPTTGTNLLANPGFESGATGWSETAPAGPIITNSSIARTGSWYAWLGGADSITDALFQNVAIPSSATRATLQYWYRIDTSDSASSAYDVLTVAIHSASSGARLQTLATYSNQNATGGGWVQSSAFDLTAYRGQTIRLVFTSTTDPSLITNFRIDDVVLAADTAGGSSANHTALWYNAAESGWGINFNHQGDIVFGTLFTYDSSGQPMWLVLPAGNRTSGETFSGTLYRTTGPVFYANPFTPITAANLTVVGTMTVTFSGSNATLSYGVNGVTVNKSVTKQQFGTRVATCTTTTSDRSSATNYQDLWWDPDESGWGVNITHQDNTLFATLFTYAPSGQGIWYVMSNGVRQSNGSYLGTLYQTTGPAFNANPFTPIGAGNLRTVGTMRFSFTNGNNGTLTYSVDGITVTKSITRQVFSSPVPSCS